MNPFYTMPHILIETSEGNTAHSLQDELFKEREIELVGEITSESAYAIILQLRCLQKADPEAPITLYINSPGGEVASGLALYDVMQAVKCPVRTVCLGTAASMAAILFASGKERGLLPHGKVMIHDPLTTGIGGSALTIDSLSRNLMQTRQITAEILARHTGRTLDEIYACTANAFLPDFDKTLSVIRSRNISASVILQSISQLEGMYGHAAAMTLLNNCDHCLYLGGQDVETARYMGVKANRSVGTMLSMPLDSAWLFARGEQARLTKKFDLYSHRRYHERRDCEKAGKKEDCYAHCL